MLDFNLTAPDQKARESGEAKPDEVHRYDLTILGAGPAGLTAAIYAGRASLATVVLAGPAMGGQLSSTNRIENFPGFPEGIEGSELAQRFRLQAERFGAEIVHDAATEVNFSNSRLAVRTGRQVYQGRTVIVATGAVPRRLGVPGEARLFGRGVSTCATCDGFFYQDKRVVVVGGGDSALDEGLFLTRFAREVVVVHRRDELRATKIYQDRAFANPKMAFVWNSVVKEILGEKRVTGVRVLNGKDNETEVIEADGVFIYVGTVPQTELFVDQVALDDRGYVATDERQQTSVPGVFAAGDVQNRRFRQVVSAAADGANAAMEAERFLAVSPGRGVATTGRS